MRQSVPLCVQPHVAGLTIALAALTCLCVAPSEAPAETLSVDSESNIYASGLSSIPGGMAPNGPGILPPSVALSPGTGRVLRFLSVSG